MAAAAAASGGTGISMELAYDDVTWEVNKRGHPISIGRGANGTVYAGTLHGQPVAIKAEELRAGEEEAWMKAARLHYTATCPNIVAVHGIIVDREGGKVTHHLVMERLAGTMTALLLTPGGPYYKADMKLRLQLLADAAGGLAYLHAASVIHADVKPDNVLLTAVTPRSPFPAAKLADFGSSVQRRTGSTTHSTLQGERGTLMYMDPRLFDPATSITMASDVYSLGVMAWQVLSGHTPYEAEMIATLPPTATVPQKVEALRRHVLGGGRPATAALVERGVSAAIVALVQSCWAPAQVSRPAMAAVHRALEAATTAAEAGAAGGSDGGCRPASGPAPVPAPPPPTTLHAAAALTVLSTAAPIAALEPAVAASYGPTPLAYEWDDKLVLHGHNKQVCSLALLPGGRLVSGDYGGTVRLWDATRSGEATAVLEGHVRIVSALVALLDGRRLAAGVCSGRHRKDDAIVVWDTGVVPPTRCATIGCGSGVYALAVLCDGRLAAGCADAFVKLVYVGADAGVMTTALKGHGQGVAALAVLPDGTLVSGSYDDTVRIWDVGARSCVATLAGHTNGVFALAVLADGRLASGSADGSVRLWDVATRACVGVLEGHTDVVSALAALSDGRLASGSHDNTIRVWDTRPVADGTSAAGDAAGAGGGAAHATPVVVLEGHFRDVLALQPLPGGRLASGSVDETVRLWCLPPP